MTTNNYLAIGLGITALVAVIVLLVFLVIIPNLNRSPFEQKYKTIQYRENKNSPARALKIPANYPERLYKLQCVNGTCPMLGKGYDTRTINLNDPSKIPPGKQVFVPTKLNILTNQNCFSYNLIGKMNNEASTTKDTSETIRRFANDTSASVNLPTDTALIQATANVTLKQDTSRSTDIQTASLKIEAIDGEVEFIDNDTCRTNNLNPLLITDFFNLPLKIKNPHLVGNWSLYENFFKKWGSHVVTKIIFGSRLEVWDSIEGLKTDITKALTAKVCASYKAKPKPTIAPGQPTQAPSDTLKVEACNTTTKEDIDRASSLNTKHSVKIVGGEKTLRNKLVNFKDIDLNSETVIAFLDSSELSNQATGFVLEPLWDILIPIFSAKCNSGNKKFCDDDSSITQRLINLQFCFAQKALQCPTLRSGNTIYQQIRAVPSEDNSNVETYGCWAKGLGCTGDDGCKYSWGWSQCYALGDNVFQKGDEYKMSYDEGNKQYKTKPRTDYYGDWSWSDDVRNSCRYDYSKSQCRCIGNKPALSDRFIWRQDQS